MSFISVWKEEVTTWTELYTVPAGKVLIVSTLRSGSYSGGHVQIREQSHPADIIEISFYNLPNITKGLIFMSGDVIEYNEHGSDYNSIILCGELVDA